MVAAHLPYHVVWCLYLGVGNRFRLLHWGNCTLATRCLVLQWDIRRHSVLLVGCILEQPFAEPRAHIELAAYLTLQHRVKRLYEYSLKRLLGWVSRRWQW